MFIAPQTSIPQSTLDAAKLIEMSNSLLLVLHQQRREAFLFFWRPNGQLRSKEEINEILVAMDRAALGQSTRFFVAAKALVDFILLLAPGSLGDDDWMPAYEYEIDPITQALRVK